MINNSDVVMPICKALYKVIYQHADIKANIYALFDCQLKPEFSDLD